MTFGKVAHDLVMRMQKIDGDNYPEVLFYEDMQMMNTDFLNLLCLFNDIYL